jgi:hypothetical protein
VQDNHSWAFGPPVKQEKVSGAGLPAAFGGTGFQPVRRTGKMPVPPRTFQSNEKVFLLASPLEGSPFT